MRTNPSLVACALAIVASQSAALAGATFKSSAVPGTRHYRYTSLERAQGQPDKRYRVDFDLITGTDRGVVAVIREAQSATGEVWSTPTVNAECKKALHGGGRTLARVTLSPISPEAAKSLGEPFMATCAPAAYFFPIADIVNVSLIQTSPRFHLSDLALPGASARFEGFDTKLDRLGISMVASSPGGEIKLSALTEHTATVDWSPDPMQLTIVHHAEQGSPEVTLSGVERYAFRLEIDARSGVLRHAATITDNLDLVVSMPGLPADKAPHVGITREVTIERRD